MRPVSLALQAFGSYAGELHVDFGRLSRHGIFAISGPTGAGKSTIFDALVYALYDDLPGFRVDGNVRSQYADPSTPTSVCLEFVVHGERWRVERRPTQLVCRTRGSGSPVERKSAVVLGRVGEDGELVPGTAMSRKDEVRRRIDALVGLTKDQFEQVVLIPQGRFEEVLKADTSRRAPLLRRLFPVEVFTRVTESSRSIAATRQAGFEEATRARDGAVAKLHAAYDSALAQLPAALRAATYGGDGPHELETDRLATYVDDVTAALARVDELVLERASKAETARAELDDARRSAADWDRWQADVLCAASFEEEEQADAVESVALERARRLSDLRGALAEWEEARRRLDELEPELVALLERVDAQWPEDLDRTAGAGSAAGGLVDAHAAGVLAERLLADARRLEGEVARHGRLLEAARSLDVRRTGLEERRVELAERTLKLDAEEGDVALVAEEVQRLRTVVSSLEAVSEAVRSLEREHQTAARRADAVAQLERAGEELAVATADAARATALADHARASWRDGLAGRLARLLEDGAPCPTCGAFDHPAPAEWREDGADDETLAQAEAARDEALRRRSGSEQRAAAARGAVEVLSETRPLDVVDADLAARREVLADVRDAAARLTVAVAEEDRRRSALLASRAALGEDARALDTMWARLEVDAAAHRSEVEAFVDEHGALESPAARAAARAALGADVGRLAGILRDRDVAQAAWRHCGSVVEPVARELGAAGPCELSSWLVDDGEVETRTSAFDERRSRRAEVRRRIADYEARAGGPAGAAVRPDVPALEAAARAVAAEHVSLVARRAVLADRVAVLATGPGELAEAARSIDAARTAFERAKTVADRCAGVGGGAATLRLSLENWVLADYLRQVLVQANHRLDEMTDGRFALELTEGVTDGRKPWGLDLSVFDACTGQTRPATTLSGGETFMAALSLALGLADVVSCGSNRDVGALFVDEGFGSLDPQSLDAVIDVLRSLEDGGRVVGIVSHVRELQQALPAGVTVEPSGRGSIATLHYPPD